MMKTFTRSLLSLAALALTAFSAQANEVILGYCDGMIADAENGGTITGVSGSNVKVSGAIHLLKEDLAQYVGHGISKLRVGIPSTTKLPASMDMWIRTTQKGSNVAEGSVTPAVGWNILDLSADYDITGEEDLWIGFSYIQGSKLNILSFVGETNAEGCYIANKTNWSNYANKNFGSLSIEAVVEGDDLPSYDLAIKSATIPNTLCKWGDPIKLTTVVRNNASAPANAIVRWTLGAESGEVAVNGTLEYRDKKTVKIDIPTDNQPEGEATLKVEVLWTDGTVDENLDNNVAEIPVDITSNIAFRKMVCEEATGLWCGWCVRGIVGLNYMTENYDNFIGIGVHNGDEFVYSAYDSWIGSQISGYPSCVCNRNSGVLDPAAGTLENYYNKMDKLSEYNVAVEAEFPAQEDTQADEVIINVKATVTPLASISGTDLRMAIVITEDSLIGAQHNYYAGGGSGAMGGFENMGSTVNYPLPDVARIIAPSATGETGIFPTDVVKGENYTYELGVKLPKIRYNNQQINFDNTHRLAAIALLIDGKTKEILNAAKLKNAPESTNGIREIAEEEAQSVSYMTLDGRPTSADAKGVMLRVSTLSNGKVKVQKIIR